MGQNLKKKQMSMEGIILDRNKHFFWQDYKRARPNATRIHLRDIIKSHEIGYLFFSRCYDNAKNKLTKHILLKIILRYRRRYGIELNTANMGGGVLLIHPWNITIHNEARIGDNVTLFKGATIGMIACGSRKGVPILGNNVTMYVNSTCAGNITIGNDVIISAGAFVNVDVPDNSIVIGNPASIYKKKQ